MNKVILMGRLTRDPDVRYSNGEQATAVARFTLAVDRRVARRDGEQTADFIGCVAFGRTAEFVEKYFRQGMTYGNQRPHPDRQLHQSRWTESVYHRCGCRRSRSLQRAKLPAMHFAIAAEWVVDISRRHRLRRVPQEQPEMVL